MSNTRPVWFLDIDGVINASKSYPKIWNDWKRVLVPATDNEGHTVTYPINYAVEVIDFINDMATKVDILWLTSWGNQGNTCLAPAVGINGPFLVADELVDVSNGSTYTFAANWFKKQAIIKLAMGTYLAPPLYGDRPVIWTDDDARKATRLDVAAMLDETPTCLISPHESVGLRPEELERIATFVKKYS